MRRSFQVKHDDFPLVDMSKTMNPEINLSTSMSKWNAKINPKFAGEKRTEADSISPQMGRVIKKPNTA